MNPAPSAADSLLLPEVRLAWQQYETANQRCHDLFLLEQELGPKRAARLLAERCRTCGRRLGRRGRRDCPGDCRTRYQAYDRERKKASYVPRGAR